MSCARSPGEGNRHGRWLRAIARLLSLRPEPGHPGPRATSAPRGEVETGLDKPQRREQEPPTGECYTQTPPRHAKSTTDPEDSWHHKSL